MKAVCLFALCLMAGVVSSEFAWKVGKSYTYAVRGRVMSGITEINTQYAGLEMNYNVILNVVGHNTIVLKPTHIKLVEVNDKIHGGWRDGEFRGEHTVELTEEFRAYLESPIEFTLEQGIVTSLKVENNLPMWAINMKKAQVSHFVLDTTGVNVVIKGNLDRKTNNVRPEVLKHEAGFFYETMEKTIHGECKTYYTVSQNMPFVPPFQYQRQAQPSVHSVESHSVESNEFVHHDILEKIEADSREEHHAELPWHNNFHHFCNEHDQVYEIIKTVNFTDCIQKPVLGHFSPSASKYVHAAENGAGSFGHRALVSRYLACGIDRKHFTILRVRQEEQMKVGTHLVKKMIAGAIQNITLIEVVDAKTPVHLKNPIVVKNLIYTFNVHHDQGIKDTTTFTTKDTINRMDSSEELPQMDAAFLNHKSSEEIEIENIKTRFPEILENNMLPKPTLEDAPLNGLLASPLKIEGMKRRIDQLMREIVEDLTKTTDKETVAEKETLSKISTIAKILRFFSYTDVKEIYHRFADKKQTEEDKTRRNIIIDAISIAGTNPNIKLLIDLIQKRVIVGERAARVIMTFPMYIRTPTVELLKEILIFVKTAPVETEYVQIKTTAALALSTLLHQACVNTHVRNTRYPIAIYGHFCDAQVVETEFLPYFVEQLEKVIVSENKEDSHWKNLWMTVLGNIGHPRVIPVVQRLMDTLVNPFHKVRVIYMLKHLIVARTSVVVPELKVHKTDVLTREVVEKKVLPILMSAAFDKGEHPEVRMAAISLLFHCNVVDVTLWQQLAYSTWFEVSQEVHSFIYNTLKNLAELKTWTNEINHKMIKNARHVLTICKPITAGLTKSRNIFVTDFIQEHLSGFFTKLSYWGSKDSMIPNHIHYKNTFTFGNGAYDEVPLEMSFHGHTIQKLINHLLEQVYTPSTTDREAHEDLAQIRDILGIKERKQTDAVEGRFYVKIQNEMERMFSFDKHTLEKLIRQFNVETLPKLRTGYPIHFQKTLHLREHLMEVPTIFGFPCTYNFRMPVHVSLRGLVKLVTEDNKDFQIQAELHPVYAWKTHEKLSFKVPFVGKKYQTGFQRHVVSEFPFRALVRLAPRGQVEVAVTPAHLKRDELHQINLVTFHQKPYTVIVTDSLWPTAHKEGGVMKIVKAVETPYKKELTFGKKTLGLAFKLESETHYKIQNEGKSAWMEYLNRFHSLTSLLNLNWMGEPSLRLSKRQLTLDMTESETKTFVFVFGRERVTKKNVDTLVKESSEEIHSTEEKVNEKNVRHIAIAIIGKKTPITTVFRTTGIQKVLEKGTHSTVQYLIEMLWTNGHLKVQLGAGKAAKEIALTLKETCPALMAIREAIVDCPIMDIQHDICVHWENKYERPIWANRHELIVLRKRLLAEELVVKVQSELKFGKTCTQLPHFIKVVGNLKRDEEMTEWALNKSPKALKCIEDEKKGFSVSPVCLWVSEQQAAALNKIHLEFNYELPTLVKNYLFQVEDYVKTVLFKNMFHDRFPVETVAGEKKVIVDFRMTPDKEFFNLHIVKPTTRLTFDNVKTAQWQWLKMILPLTSTQNIFENVRDRTLRFYSEPSCTLEGKFVNTFDNVTYKFAPHVVEKCEHVLTQDCSGKYPMSVLVKDINTEKKVVTVLLGGKTKIEIIPQGALINKGILVHDVHTEFVVLVNGRQVQNFPEVVRLPETHHTWYNNYIAKIEVMVNGGIQVITPRIRVATDAARVIVYGSNVYRNRTCGLCGNFEGNKVAELRSPKNCPLSSGSLLVASYAFPPLHAKEQGLCKIDSEIKKRVEMEENDCKINRVHIPKYTFDVETIDDVNTKKVNDFDCEINERLVRHVEGLGLCKSEQVVRRCNEGCVAKSVVPRKMWFNCTQKKSTIYKNERVVRKTLMIDEPTDCVRGY